MMFKTIEDVRQFLIEKNWQADQIDQFIKNELVETKSGIVYRQAKTAASAAGFDDYNNINSYAIWRCTLEEVSEKLFWRNDSLEWNYARQRYMSVPRWIPVYGGKILDQYDANERDFVLQSVTPYNGVIYDKETGERIECGFVHVYVEDGKVIGFY